MQPAIRVEGVGKQYQIGAAEAGYRTLRETITEAVTSPWRRFRKLSGNSTESETIWALRDVSFEVQPGEAVGIIGRNGAGKSTLLKILSRITSPTRGQVNIHGRIASLLEVGTGFHPELTGRENVFLNGAVLGMTRAEIRRKFDEIVAFAGVDKFIDTPVKRYSSGMFMRLAFSVAAHLEQEIMVVDEVLAVGDASFQKRCLGKMDEAANEGRTVLFVSHNMPSITRLCKSCIVLDEGKVVASGPTHEAVRVYLQSGLGTTSERVWDNRSRAPGNDVARLVAVRAKTEEGEFKEDFDIREPIGIEMEFDVLQPGHRLTPNFHLHNEEGVCVFVTADQDPEWRDTRRPVGRFASTAWIPGNFLSEGALVVGAAVSTMDPVAIHFYEADAIVFHVSDGLDGASVRRDYGGPIPGVVRPLLRWSTSVNAKIESHSPSPMAAV